jgi:hypothetical protein
VNRDVHPGEAASSRSIMGRRSSTTGSRVPRFFPAGLLW